jgi:hypothetical protein
LSVDTDTRLVRPTELTDASLPSYRGRHRTSEDLATKYIPPAKVTEALMPAARLATREPGAALAGQMEFPRPNPVSRLLGSSLRALRNRGPW